MKYTINGIEYSTNSPVNQHIASDLVRREVGECVSDLIEYLLDWDGQKYATYDEFENLCVHRRPNCDSVIANPEDIEPEYPDDYEGEEFECECPNCHTQFDKSDYELTEQDIFEFWLVSDYFADKLIEQGEPVLKGWHNIWGRTCSGQAIAMDGCIRQICFDMGILEGQELDWSKRV